MVRALLVTGFSGALAVSIVPSLQTIWVVAPVVGVSVASLVALESRDFPAQLSARRRVLLSGCGGALLVPLVDEIVWLAAHGMPVMVVGLVVGVLAGVLVDMDGQTGPPAGCLGGAHVQR
jgi:hypothetical protein